jgi:peroxiredoxin
VRQRPGEPAPDFTATTWAGATLRLADLRGRPLWLAFFRYASCPLCNLRVADIIERWPDLASCDLQLVAVFQSTPESIGRYVGRQEPPFPIICDPEEQLYRLYGVEHSLKALLAPSNVPLGIKAAARGFLPGRMDGTKSRVPADFLIDREGVIVDAFYGDTIGEHIPFARVMDFLDRKDEAA